MPDCDEAGHPALDEEEGMHPADAAVLVGVNENLEGANGGQDVNQQEGKARKRPWHHDRANGPVPVGPNMSKWKNPQTMLNPSVAQTW